MPRIRSSVEVATEYETVRRLYERADGLDTVSPSVLELSFIPIVGPLEPLQRGSRFTVSISPFGIGPMVGGVCEIVEASFDDDGGFIEDQMDDGPFESWRHRRTLEATEYGTHIEDDLSYGGPPLGVLGQFLSSILLTLAFHYRRRRLKELYGIP